MTAPEPAMKRTWGSHVSRVLGAAGLSRAVAETTSIRGHYRYAPGFEVQGCNQSWETGYITDAERDAGYVTVKVQTIDSFSVETKRPHDEVVDESIPVYLNVLESAGFEVEERRNSRGRYLVVHGRH